MPRRSNEYDLSELEQEFELEMDDLEADEELEDSGDFEQGDSEYGEPEFEDNNQAEWESDEETAGYAERFYELSQMEFEYDGELEQEVTDVLNEMAEHFFGAKLLKQAGRRALKYASKRLNIPSLKVLTQMLGTVGMPLISKALAATPQGAAVLAALNTARRLSSEAGEDTQSEVWDNYAQVCREAYERLAESVADNENAGNPMVAAELATDAFQGAFRTVANQAPFGASSRRTPAIGWPSGSVRDKRAAPPSRRRRSEIRYQHVLQPGERVVVNGQRLYIVRRR